MKKERILFFGFLMISILLIGNIYAEQRYCCERTETSSSGIGGAWCMVAEESQCDESYLKAPTSCESTSFCRSGCCYNNNDGSCSVNTPKKTCEENNGIWSSDPTCNIAQCKEGCCIQGSNAFIDTITGCKYGSSLLGLSLNFNPAITDEIQCRLQTTSEDKGACVYENEDKIKTCRFTTRGECIEIRKQETGETTEQATKSFFQRVFGGNNEQENTISVTSEVEFFESRLCTDERLETNCLKTRETVCNSDNGKVYFKDSCGNLANIYDSTKYEDELYWSRVYEAEQSCGFNDLRGNQDSKTCGNCNFLSGSICGTKETGNSPEIGNYICKSLSCTYQGKTYDHAESWCATSSLGNKGVEDNLPGSEHAVLKCNNGEITAELCDPLRTSICSEQEIVKGFTVAGCITNNWADCYTQTTEKDCENTDKRFCEWIGSKWTEDTAKCIPKYAPGLEFWKTDDTKAEEICSRATVKCKVTYEKSLISGEYKCKKNCFCLTNEFKNFVSDLCTSIGDCGVSVNYLNQEGYNEEEDLYKKRGR